MIVLKFKGSLGAILQELFLTEKIWLKVPMAEVKQSLLHFKVKVFFKEIILDGPLAKTKYYAMGIEFQ